MRILTVDVGTGTQDIFLYDSRLGIENGFKLVVPSPTLAVRRKIQAAARSRKDILLTGVMMGGGPSAWAAEDHVKAGLRVYATPAAARTLNDDLEAVRAAGIELVSEDEAHALPEQVLRVPLADFDFQAIVAAFASFGVSLAGLAAVVVAVFDHGDAPAQVSDRQFRFDYLAGRIQSENRLSAFAYRAADIPPIMTRLLAVARSAPDLDAQLVVMDTAPAAVLGAALDPQVARWPEKLITNVGNFHTLAFRLGEGGIEGVFEHHTGFLNTAKLDGLLAALAAGNLLHADVFEDDGHGALVYRHQPMDMPFSLAAVGPRRSMLRDSIHQPLFAAPFGDMMLAGCFGMLSAAADLLPEVAEPVRRSLAGHPSSTPPWEVA